jgi:hypothetical protein
MKNLSTWIWGIFCIGSLIALVISLRKIKKVFREHESREAMSREVENHKEMEE